MLAASVTRSLRPFHVLVALLAAVLALGAGSLLAAPAAHASAQNLSIMMDDDLLLYRGDDVRDNALKRMRSLGVDVVRVTVLWEVVAEDARKGRRARKFKASDPRTYPRTNWDKYDRLVKAGHTLGIRIYFNVTGPGPSWGHAKAPKKEAANRRTWKPKAKEFGKFVTAVGKRYNGSYIDENDGRTKLPAVQFWSLYNEPNQGGWLTPQYERVRGRLVPASPRLYRELWYEGRLALRRTGHDSDVILAGETAPLGRSQKGSRTPMRPKLFIREFFCTSPSNKKYKGSAARARNCGKWSKIKRPPGGGAPLRYTAWAHHPYTKDLAPSQRDPNRDSITLANIGELTALLDTMADKTGYAERSSSFAVLTEFGYETNPPDPFNGISLAQQAEYLNVGDYIAYKDPKVFGNTQFLLKDVAPVRRHKKNSKLYWFTYQSGLFDLDGKAKPAAAAWALPFVVTGEGTDSVGGRALSFWGQLRFRPNGVASEVLLQWRPQGATDFQTVGDPIKVPASSPFGFWEAQRTVPGPGTWRAAWVEGGLSAVSREIPVG